MKKINLVISYRVLQSWRLPVFLELSNLPNIKLNVFVGQSFPGTKVVNDSKINDLSFCTLLSGYNFFLRRKRGNVCIPFNPLLIFYLFKVKPDIIVSEGLSNLFNNFQCFIYSKLKNIPIIQWGLGDLPVINRSPPIQFLRNILQYYESFSDGCLAYSTHAFNYYSNLGINKNFIQVVLNSVDIDTRRREIYKAFSITKLEDLINFAEKDQIVYIGALEPNKNVDKLLILFQRLKSYYPVLKLLIIGDGVELDRLKSIVKNNKLSNVKFAGRLTNSLAEQVCCSKLLILPSLGGLVFTEAIIHGLPVVCGPADGTEIDLLAHQSEFVLSEPLSDINIDKWYESCRRLLSTAELRNQIRLNGFKLLPKLGSKIYANKIRDLSFKLHSYYS